MIQNEEAKTVPIPSIQQISKSRGRKQENSSTQHSLVPVAMGGQVTIAMQ